MDAIKHFINSIASPTTIYAVTVVGLVSLMKWGKTLVRPKIAGGAFLFFIAFFAFSMTDEHFRRIITLPDNFPITLMLVTVGFFTWYSIRRGTENDQRQAEGRPLLEKEQGSRFMTWPNLVYIEFICLILVFLFLLFWSIYFKAPLEEPANPNITPNPSKAPWYFLGLQEMLVYYDPWLAGVVFPGLIVVGLMAIPFLDYNKEGNGYFTFEKRKFAISMFMFGFVVQWVLLIMLGTFMRGPGWNFFGPYEDWDPHKVVPLVNINLSEIIWVKVFNTALPKIILIRESFGILLVVGYLFGLPWILSKSLFKNFFKNLNFVRYQLLCLLFLALMSLPIKMMLRWTLNLKYIVAIPEYFFNI